MAARKTTPKRSADTSEMEVRFKVPGAEVPMLLALLEMASQLGKRGSMKAQIIRQHC